MLLYPSFFIFQESHYLRIRYLPIIFVKSTSLIFYSFIFMMMMTKMMKMMMMKMMKMMMKMMMMNYKLMKITNSLYLNVNFFMINDLEVLV